jgi:hypothetical protein
MPFGTQSGVGGPLALLVRYNETMDAFAGIEFGKCCWRLRLLGRHFKTRRTSDANHLGDAAGRARRARRHSAIRSVNSWKRALWLRNRLPTARFIASSPAAAPLLASGCCCWLCMPPAQAQPLDGIVAVVNNDVIVNSELQAEIDLVLPELQARGTAIPSRDVLEKQVLERLILKRLQMQQAETLGHRGGRGDAQQRAGQHRRAQRPVAGELQQTLEAGRRELRRFPRGHPRADPHHPAPAAGRVPQAFGSARRRWIASWNRRATA